MVPVTATVIQITPGRAETTRVADQAECHQRVEVPEEVVACRVRALPVAREAREARRAEMMAWAHPAAAGVTLVRERVTPEAA